MNIGMIGLGNMGQPMAANILKAGYRLTIYDLRRGRGEPLEAVGAQWAGSPQAVAARSDVVLTSLPSPQAVEAVVLAEDGVFAGLNAGSTYIDTSTNAPSTMRHIAEIGDSKGLRVLEAPVSGGAVGATDATLTIFVGGNEGDLEPVRPLLQSIGRNVVHMGSVGVGNTVKLVNNVMSLVNFMGACEAMALGVKSGIDPNTLLEVIRPSTGHSIIFERCMETFLAGKPFGSVIDNQVKDLHLAVELGEEGGVPLVLSARCEEIFRRYSHEGRGQEDLIEVLRDAIRQAGVAI